MASRRFGLKRLERPRESRIVRYGQNVRKYAGPDAVVLADALNSWPIPTFGPKVVALHHLNPLVPDQFERNARVRAFFEGADDQTRMDVLRRYHVTHVIVTTEQDQELGGFLQPLARRRRIGGDFILYTLEFSTR
jgi:hypothetical protein